MSKKPTSKPQGKPTNNPGGTNINLGNSMPRYQTPPPPPPTKEK